MSRNKKRKQKDMRNGEGNSTQQSERQRKVNWKRVLGLLTAIALLVGSVGVGIHLFGGVDMSSSDVGNVPSNSSKANTTTTLATTDTTTASAQQTTDSAQTVATTKAPVTTKAATPTEGHYIQPASADWNLKLVNQWNPLDSSYSLQLVTYSGSNQYDGRAIEKLRALVNAGSAYNLSTISLYRTIELQTKLFENQVKSVMARVNDRTKAEKEAATLVARPWTSEHNLGLAADLLGSGYSDLNEKFENTEAFRWLKANCADYGFILRYPKNKVDVTGVLYEPWHYRYVGEEAAKVIMSRGITLEEYLQELGK